LLKHRIIPCLLLKDGGLVKTTRFSKPVYVGDPINAIRIFNEKEADELMVLDITASRDGREPDFAAIEEFAGECFMPLCYGGGIRTVEHARRILASGVEKICLQTAVLRDPTLVSRIADSGGSQAVLVSIDVKRDWLGRPKLYSAATAKSLRQAWGDQLEMLVRAGAGEVVLNAVDRDGTMSGMDLELIRDASARIQVPLIAVGGAGSLRHLREAIEAGASAVAAGAYFVFHGPHRAVLITYPRYEELEQLLNTV
jgi:imidazole glycerol-phosphate synthase subunit HisF